MTDPVSRPPLLLAARLAVAAALLAVAGAAWAGPGVAVSGSAYVDYWWIQNRTIGKASPEGVTVEGSLKVGVDVSDDLSFSAKACFSCHGIEMEHAYFDYQPKTWFNVQMGRLAIPFGEYSERVDPSGHRTVSAPLIYDMGRMVAGGRSAMNLGVVPQPYTDTGVLAYGIVWLGEHLQAWYGAYAVAGMKGSNDIDWMSMRELPYTDNNRLPAGGGRITLAYSAEPGAFLGDSSIGASYTAGRYDKDVRLGYEAWAADATVRLGRMTVRGEYAQRKTDLDPTVTGYRYVMIDDWFRKDGYYVELEHPLGKYVGAVYRLDQLRRSGVPLPSSASYMTLDTRITRYTAGLLITPAQAIYVKLGYEYWTPNDVGGFRTPPATSFPAFHSAHVGFGGAF